MIFRTRPTRSAWLQEKASRWPLLHSAWRLTGDVDGTILWYFNLCLIFRKLNVTPMQCLHITISIFHFQCSDRGWKRKHPAWQVLWVSEACHHHQQDQHVIVSSPSQHQIISSFQGEGSFPLGLFSHKHRIQDRLGLCLRTSMNIDEIQFGQNYPNMSIFAFRGEILVFDSFSSFWIHI